MKSFLVSLACVLFFAMGLLWLMFRNQIDRKGNTMLKILLICFGLYIATTLFILLNPVYYYRRLQFSTSRLNLEPFRILREWKANPVNLIGNIVMFMPLGFFVVLFHPERKTWQKILSCLFGGLFLSGLIETAQLWTGRVSDIDDTILNMIGSLLGGCICLLEHKAGFDRTRVGRFLLPAIPKQWQGHMRVQQYSFILLVSAFSGIMLLNYLITRPQYTTYEYQGHSLQMEAKNVLVKDSDSGEILFAVESDEQISPASTLKILASLTAMDYVNENDTIRVGKEIYYAPMDCSRAGLEAGMELTVRQLLEGILLPSGADAIYALGTHCGRIIAGNAELSVSEAMKTFADAMNRKAEALGAKNTYVVNPDGYDAPAQHSSASDILLITASFLEHPVLKEICSLPGDLILVGDTKKLSLTNTNNMLHKENLYYNSAVAGVKTGTTNKAGNCLVSVFTIDDRQYLCAVMGSSYDGKFRDTQALFQYCRNAVSAKQ